MATSMEADSEVHFKERQEGKGVKTETAGDDATLQFEFRASTPAASPSGRGAEHRGGDAEEPRRIELKKFSLRPEKYDGKVDFEGWVNQFEEYAALGQWTEEEKSSLLFLSLTAGARMYFVGLPEREKMAYASRVEALRRRFGQETDTSIALQELAGLRRGKNQSAKELADSARRLASRAYHSNDYASQEKAALHAFQTAVGEDLQLKCAERSCRTLEMAVETVEIQERYTKKAVRALKQEESDMALQLRTMGEKLETLMGEIKDDREQRKQWAARRESGRRRKADMECHACHQKGHFARECPTNTEGRSGNGQLVPLILMSYRATPQASTGVTPNMMMLGRQTRLPVQAMYGAPLGPEEEASTVSEYVAALQGGLRAAYRHARAGLQRAALHQKHDYDGKVQRREYQAGELVWIHDITLERTRGTKLQFPWFGPALITKVLDRGRVVVRRKRDKPLVVMHVDRLETYRGTAVPAWMTTEQRECVAV